MKKLILKWQCLNEKYDFFAYFLGMYFFVYLPIVSLTTFITVSSIFTKTILIISIFLLLFALPNIVKKITFSDLAVIGTFFLLGLFSFVIFKNNRNDIVSGTKIFLTSLWIYYLLFRFCQENQKRINIVSFGSIVNLVILLIVSIVHLKKKQSENMTLCYETLFFASLCLSYAFSQKNINYKVFAFSLATLLGIVTIYIFGSRGPILFIVLLILINVYLKIQSGKVKKIYLLSLVSIIAIGLIIPFFCMLTYSSENIFAIKVLEIYYKVFSLSGREYLYSIEMNGFIYSPIIGHGLFGDRFLSIGFIFSNPQTTNFSSMVLAPYTTYSHNIFIELLVSLGAPLTIVLITIFLVFFLNYILPAINDKKHNNIYLLPLMITGLCSLLLSNSFAVSNYFWGFLGSCIYLYSNDGFILTKNKRKSIFITEQYFELNI